MLTYPGRAELDVREQVERPDFPMDFVGTGWSNASAVTDDGHGWLRGDRGREWLIRRSRGKFALQQFGTMSAGNQHCITKWCRIRQGELTASPGHSPHD